MSLFNSPEQRSRRAVVLPPALALALALVFALALALASTSTVVPSCVGELPVKGCTIPTPMHDLKVKVTDLELLC